MKQPPFVTHTVMHTHRHGQSIYLLSCNHFPSEKEVVKACAIDYEPDREEYLDIEAVGDLVTTIPENPKKFKVPAVIIEDHGGQEFAFDAAKGLKSLALSSMNNIAILAERDWQNCSFADCVADYGGPIVNAIQASGPYEVWINPEKAKAFLSTLGFKVKIT